MLYSYRCPKNHAFDDFVAMSDRDRPRRCPTCGAAADRDINAEKGVGAVCRTGAVTFTPYLSNAAGCFSHEIRQARRDEHGNWVKPGRDGKLRRLNPPGFQLDPKSGDVVIDSATKQKQFERMHGVQRVQ